jgi:hypothetical protein
MFPLFMPMLIGAGLGAFANKKNPLKGALLGAGAGAVGGQFAPGLLGGGQAAASSGGLLGSEAASSVGGLLGNPMTAASYGTGLGTQQTAMLAAQEAGMGSIPIGKSLLGSASQIAKDTAPVMNAVSTGMSMAGQGAEQPMAPPPPLMSQPLDLSPVLNSQQQEMARTFEEDMKRRQAMSQFAQYAMGGR